MDKEMIAIVIAQNGLGTAASLLTAKARKIEKQIEKAKDDAAIEQLQKSLTSTRKLIAVLEAANVGVNEYLGRAPF